MFPEIFLRASLQSKQGMAHLPKQTDQMEQLVYYAVSVCFRSTTVERRYPECVGHRWSKKATYGNPKTTKQPEESLSKNFEEIIPIIAKKGVGGRQLALAKTSQYKKTQCLNYHLGKREERGAFSRQQLRIWQASGGKEKVQVEDNASIIGPDNRGR